MFLFHIDSVPVFNDKKALLLEDCLLSLFLMLITVVRVLIYTLIFLECEGNELMTFFFSCQNPYAYHD